MEIKVLGPGCAKCNLLEDATRKAVEKAGLDATVEKVTDMRRSWATASCRRPRLSSTVSFALPDACPPSTTSSLCSRGASAVVLEAIGNVLGWINENFLKMTWLNELVGRFIETCSGCRSPASSARACSSSSTTRSRSSCCSRR